MLGGVLLGIAKPGCSEKVRPIGVRDGIWRLVARSVRGRESSTTVVFYRSLGNDMAWERDTDSELRDGVQFSFAGLPTRDANRVYACAVANVHRAMESLLLEEQDDGSETPSPTATRREACASATSTALVDGAATGRVNGLELLYKRRSSDAAAWMRRRGAAQRSKAQRGDFGEARAYPGARYI